MEIEKGQQAPEFTLLDQDGDEWSLAAQRGRPVVLYFYPADDSPGCTNQACDIRDHWADFAETGAAVAGISPDDVDSHRTFAAGRDLPHTLLADPALEVLKRYGAWGMKDRGGVRVEGVIRSSVVIDADGKVAAVFAPIRPEEQTERTLPVVRALQGDGAP